MDPKLGPNRIFDAEALRKPLGGLLERSWRLLEPKKVSLEPSWRLSAGDLGDVGGDMAKTTQENRSKNNRPGGMRRPALDGLPSIQA